MASIDYDDLNLPTLDDLAAARMERCVVALKSAKHILEHGLMPRLQWQWPAIEQLVPPALAKIKHALGEEGADPISRLNKVAECAIRLLSPPYRRHRGGIRLPLDDREQKDWDDLSDALLAAGFGWEEYT